VISAKASHVASSEAAHVATATEAAHVATAAKAAHVASAATTVSSAAAAGLRPSGKKAAGKHRACQNHHHSSFHDILLFDKRNFRHRALSDAAVYEQANANVAMDRRWGCMFFVSTKFPFNHPN
jgi:hypothetical protein